MDHNSTAVVKHTILAFSMKFKYTEKTIKINHSKVDSHKKYEHCLSVVRVRARLSVQPTNGQLV